MTIMDLQKHVENACTNSSYVFQNEEQFRYALVKELEKAYPQVVVQKLENNPNPNANEKYIYIDIMVKENDNEYVFIELKYGTIGALDNDLNYPSPSPNKIPDNNTSNRKNGFEENVDRLSKIVKTSNKNVQGFAVLLINHNYSTLSTTFTTSINGTKFYCYIQQA